jgi:hypothetical protein
MLGSTLGVYSFGLIFVSARTNKRHHHLPFPKPYALNHSTGVTQGNPLEGTSSTQTSLWAWSPDRKQDLITSGTLPYPLEAGNPDSSIHPC